MGDATVESLLSQALGSLSFAVSNIERGVDGNAVQHIEDAKRDIRAALRSDSPVGEEWTPTAENVNALPEPLRRYIHDLETRCDPAGEVRELSVARDTIRALEAEREGAIPVWLFEEDVRKLRRPTGTTIAVYTDEQMARVDEQDADCAVVPYYLVKRNTEEIEDREEANEHE